MKLSIEPAEQGVTEPGEIHLHIRFRPANLPALIIMLLVHALLLYFVLSQHILKKNNKPDGETTVVFIADPKAKPKPEKAVQKKSAPAKPVTLPRNPRAISPPHMAQRAPDTPSPIRVTDANSERPVDMSAMLEAARERRRTQENSATQANAAAADVGREMTSQEKAEANVKHSQRMANSDGGGGLFRITQRGVRTAMVSFKGWDRHTPQSFQVDSGLGGDLDKAIVRRVIIMIRSRFKGEFTWIDHREREMHLSARLEDDAELESYLMKELFPVVR